MKNPRKSSESIFTTAAEVVQRDFIETRFTWDFEIKLKVVEVSIKMDYVM